MKLSNLLLICSSLTIVAGCSNTKKEIQKIVITLDEADLLLESREFQGAYDKSMAARDALIPLLEQSKKREEHILLYCRASLNAFLAKNTRLIEESPPKPKSLVRLPELAAYQDYHSLLDTPMSMLETMLKQPQTLSLEEKQAAYSTLAAIKRLASETLPEASHAYIHAIEINRQLLQRAQGEIGGSIFTHMLPLQEQNLLSEEYYLQLALIETYLADEKWEEALKHLKTLSGGDDLAYFSTQWRLLENNIADLEKKIAHDHEREPSIIKNSAETDSKRKTLGHYSTNEMGLMRMELELTHIKNQIIYRSICYHNLEMKKEFSQALSIIAAADTSIAKNIKTLLKAQ
jgi:hypothetical protein